MAVHHAKLPFPSPDFLFLFPVLFAHIFITFSFHYYLDNQFHSFFSVSVSISPPLASSLRQYVPYFLVRLNVFNVSSLIFFNSCIKQNFCHQRFQSNVFQPTTLSLLNGQVELTKYFFTLFFTFDLVVTGVDEFYAAMLRDDWDALWLSLVSNS